MLRAIQDVPVMSRYYLFSYNIAFNAFYKSIFNFLRFCLFFFFWLVYVFVVVLVFFAVRSNQTLLLPWSNHTANGRHWQRRGMKRGPIGLLTTDFIPGVKGLLSVTFTWFKSLTQLNQKSMKSHRIYFWVELSSFQVVCSSFFFFFFCHASIHPWSLVSLPLGRTVPALVLLDGFRDSPNWVLMSCSVNMLREDLKCTRRN